MEAPDLRTIEARVIGAAMASPQSAGFVVANIPASRFVDPFSRDAASAVHHLFREGQPVTTRTVADASRIDESALRNWLITSATQADLPHFSDILKARYTARALESRLRLGVVEAERAAEGSEDVRDVIATIHRDLSALAFETEGAVVDTHISAAVAEAEADLEAWDRGERPDMAPSGFYTLDRTTGGLPVGELTTLAAMTGAGKTALLTQSARGVALAELSGVGVTREAPRPVGLFSAEMSRKQIVHRMASGMARVNLRVLAAGKATEAERERYRAALRALATFPIYVDPEPAPTFAHIHARLIQWEAMGPGGIAYVGVDYDEKLDTEGATEELRVSAIAKGLKETAKRFSVPVLALSQYSRSAAPNEYPSDGWLRYSGKKEQESAQILHWHYPKYWVDKGRDPGGVVEYDPHEPDRGRLVVSKNRFGPTGAFPLFFEPETVHFTDPNEPTDGGRPPVTPF